MSSPERESRDHSGRPPTREALWRRLDALVTKAGQGLATLSDPEVEDLGKLYRAAATHLALVRTFGASVRQKEDLNRLVSRAHDVIYGRPRQGWNASNLLLAFLAFPQTVRKTWRYHLLAALLMTLGVLYGYAGAARDPEWALEFVAPGDPRGPYASRDELYSSLMHGRPSDSVQGAGEDHREIGGGEKTAFAAFLWQNNTRVALLGFFSGFLLGIPTVFILLMNGALLGVYTHTFHQAGLAYEWWAWILPHGVTELGAIVLLAGGGLFLGHRLLAPGEHSRRDAFRMIRGDVLRLALFAFPMLFLAAIFESFVRQSGMSEPGRYAFAALTAVLWGIYLGFARVPRKAKQQLAERKTLAERKVPLPVTEEILGLS